jgi:hypothetical protein
MGIKKPASIPQHVWNAAMRFDGTSLRAAENLENVLINRIPVFHAVDFVDSQVSYDFFNKPITQRVTNLDSGKPNPDTFIWIAAPRFYFIDACNAGVGGTFGGASFFAGTITVTNAAEPDAIAIIDTINTEELKRRFVETGVLTAVINKRPLIPEALGLWRYPRPGNYQIQSAGSYTTGPTTVKGANAGLFHGSNGEANANNQYQFAPMQPLMFDGQGLKANISLPAALTMPATASATGGKHKIQLVCEFDAIWFQNNDQ